MRVATLGSLRICRSEEIIQEKSSEPRESDREWPSQEGWWELRSPRMKVEGEEGEKEEERMSATEERIGGE